MERGIVAQNGLPFMGAGSGFKAEFVPTGVLYALVPASSTSALGTGAVGDYLGVLTLIPAASNPGAVSIKDGNGSAQTIYASGQNLGDLKPFTVPVRARSTSGGW